VIGNQSFNTYDAFLGYITNVRLNNTTAVYTNDGLTPIVPLTNMAGTTLLLLVEGNAPFFDSSVLDNTVTVLGSVAYDTQYPQ
jgi:hypothetical protein